MMPAANQGVGTNMGFPDVCATPTPAGPVPIPYPNIGMNAMAMPFIPNILLSFAPGQNMGAKPLMTNGDNAGVAHPLVMQPGGTTMGNPRILMGGMPAAHMLVPTYGNNFNNPVGSKLVPSITNVLLGCTLAEPISAAATLRSSPGTYRRSAGGIAVLRIHTITLAADRWLAATLRRLAQGFVRGLVIDLTGNPGGVVPVAGRLADQLRRTGLPITVAIDGDTASAAELLAATLHDRAGAGLFGQRTFGKGTVRHHLITGDHLTGGTAAGTMTRPDGDPINAHGIAPDQECDATTAVQEAHDWLIRTST